MADEELLTVGEAAKIFRVTLQTIRNWIEWG
jgi:DNA-binding transcriptional MerR regulator